MTNNKQTNKQRKIKQKHGVFSHVSWLSTVDVLMLIHIINNESLINAKVNGLTALEIFVLYLNLHWSQSIAILSRFNLICQLVSKKLLIYTSSRHGTVLDFDLSCISLYQINSVVQFKSSVHSPQYSSIFVNYWGEYLTPWLINVHQLVSNYAYLLFGGEQLVYSRFLELFGWQELPVGSGNNSMKAVKVNQTIKVAGNRTKTMTSKTLKCSKELMWTATLNDMDSSHINVAFLNNPQTLLWTVFLRTTFY